MKYIDAEKLTKAIEDKGLDCSFALKMERLDTLALIDELKQEQPNDVRAEIKEYYGEDLAFGDERTKAAYHFFSAGKAFELREYEEEREKHMTDLLNNFQKGMNAGYEKAISELKEGKVECSPVMKELIDKLFGIGNTFNFGFGPKNIQQEQLPGIEEHGIPGKDFIPVEWVDACEKYGKWKIVQQEQPEVDLEEEIKNYLAAECAEDDEPSVSEIARHFYELRNHALEEAAQHVYESWMGGTMDDVRRDMVELGKALNARKEEKK